MVLNPIVGKSNMFSGCIFYGKENYINTNYAKANKVRLRYFEKE